MPYGMDAFMLGIGMLGTCQACTCAASGQDLLLGLPGGGVGVTSPLWSALLSHRAGVGTKDLRPTKGGAVLLWGTALWWWPEEWPSCSLLINWSCPSSHSLVHSSTQ